ncbi:PD-(D/E)XK nuclease domain-containing protein, partial [Prevotella sp.]
EALQQIEVKNYAAPFAMDKRTVVKLGINFSSKTRGVESWKHR